MSVFQDYAGSGTNVGGHYRWSGLTGQTTVIAGGGSIFAFRWTDPNRYCRVRQVKVAATVAVVFTTAQISDMGLFKATGWTTAPSAAGTVTQPTGLMNQMGDGGGLTTAMTSLGGVIFSTIGNNIAIATTAALTTGSPTVDSNPVGYDVFAFTGVSVGASDRITLLDTLPGFDYPLTLASNEGFLIQIPTTQGAAGKVVYYVDVVFAVNNAPF